MKKILILIFIIFAFSNMLFAQSDTAKKEVKTVIRSEMSKSPAKAIYYSLAMPGLGQYYVQSYWKIPIFFGGAIGCYYGIFSNNSKYITKNNEWNAAKNDPKSTTSHIEYLRRWKEQYRDWRDQSAMYLIGVYVLSSVDAYVGAHLYDFDASSKVSLNLNIKNDVPTVSFSYHF